MKKVIIKITVLLLLLNIVSCLGNVYLAADADFPRISIAPQDNIIELKK